MEQSISKTILTTKSLAIGYRSKKLETIIAKSINIEVNPGELVAVVGVNGVGKSTLLRTLSGLQSPLAGNVFIEDKEVNAIDPSLLASLISLVLTDQPISKNLSVFELVALGRQPYTNWIGSLGKSDLREITNALKLVAIEDLQHKKCFELSDGQLQKALIARALSQNTPLVILDEPTTHLDLYHKAYVLKLLKRLTRKTNKAILFASHEINLTIQLCDKIILLQDDSATIGTPEDLVQNGAFDKVFPPGLIVFDKNSSSFKINP